MCCQKREQEGYKYIFFLKAEQLFSRSEKWFAENIFCIMEDLNIGINVGHPNLSQN
jgi:hypothetical protein